jgi:RNA polymerase sigma-70 factor, ECF subfamily
MQTLDPEVLHEHVDRLYRSAWALCGSREDAEDLVQETFARVLARPRVLRGGEELHYLMRVLRNTFLTSRRTASRRPVTVAELEDAVAADPRPMGQPEQALEVQELFETIAGLPEDFRLALVAVDILGLSYREAAHALGIREGTITTRLFRARKQVAARLDPQSQKGVLAGRREETMVDSADPVEGVPSVSLRAMGVGRNRRELNRADRLLPNAVAG